MHLVFLEKEKQSGQQDLGYLYIDQVPGDMLRPEGHTQGVDHQKGGVAQAQVEHVRPEPVVEVPECEGAFPDVAHNGVVML